MNVEEFQRELERERELRREAERKFEVERRRADDLEKELKEAKEELSRSAEEIAALQHEYSFMRARLAQSPFQRSSERRDAEGQGALPFDELPQNSVAQPLDALISPKPDEAEGANPSGAENSCPAVPSAGGLRRRGRGGRNVISGLLPRERRVFEKSDAELDALYGPGRWKEIGEEVREELELRKREIVVVEFVAKKYAPIDGLSSPVRAQVPPAVIRKARPGPMLLAHLITQKYEQHLPLYRMERVLARAHAPIGRSVMCRWFNEAAILLAGIIRTMKLLLLSRGILRLDDTPIPLLDPDHPSGRRTSYLWPLMDDEGRVVFLWTKGHGRDGPARFIGDFKGKIQGDAAAVNISLTGGDVVFVACWAHARRGFYRVRKDFPTEWREISNLIGGLYSLEDEAKARELDADGIRQLRNERSRPVLSAIKSWAVKKKSEIIPGSGLDDAVDYLLEHFEALSVFLDDGRLSIDNNDVEREIRNVAIGRKNYLFFGGERGGENAAVFYTLIAACRAAAVDPEEYLADVLNRTRTAPPQEIAALTPQEWKRRREPVAAVSTAS